MKRKDMPTKEQMHFLKEIGFDVEGKGLTRYACDALINHLGF
jgi:hypothetical protein